MKISSFDFVCFLLAIPSLLLIGVPTSSKTPSNWILSPILGGGYGKQSLLFFGKNGAMDKFHGDKRKGII